MEYARQNLAGMQLKKNTDTINTLMNLLETLNNPGSVSLLSGLRKP